MDGKEIFLGLLILGFIVVAFFTIAFSAIYLFEKNVSCPAFSRSVERPVRYDFVAGGCFVQTERGQWVAKKNYWNAVPQ